MSENKQPENKQPAPAKGGPRFPVVIDGQLVEMLESEIMEAAQRGAVFTVHHTRSEAEAQLRDQSMARLQTEARKIRMRAKVERERSAFAAAHPEIAAAQKMRAEVIATEQKKQAERRRERDKIRAQQA